MRQCIGRELAAVGFVRANFKRWSHQQNRTTDLLAPTGPVPNSAAHFRRADNGTRAFEIGQIT